MSKLNQKRKFESPKKGVASGKWGVSEYPRKKIVFPTDKELIPGKEQDKFNEQEKLLIKSLKLNPFTVKALVSNTLAELNLYNAILPYGSTEILGDVLKTNTSIKYVKLIQSGIGAPGIVNIARGLAFNSTITHLDLSGNGSGCLGTQALAEALSKNSFLTYLNLAHNHINIKGGQAIGDLLASNRSIKELDLDENNIGNTGGTSLSEALKINTTLRVLRLSHNFVTEKGMDDIFISLMVNKDLIILDISRNQISHERCKVLSDSLKHNKTLTEINMESTYVSSSGAAIIDRAMEQNFTVVSLPLGSSYGITKGLGDCIQEKIDRNVVLQDEVYKFIEGFARVPRPVMTLDDIRLFKLLGRSSVPALEERLKSADISSETVFKFLGRYHAEWFLVINFICKGSLSPTKTSLSKLESLPSTIKIMIGEWLGMDFLGDEGAVSTEVDASVGSAGATGVRFLGGEGAEVSRAVEVSAPVGSAGATGVRFLGGEGAEVPGVVEVSAPVGLAGETGVHIEVVDG